VCAQNFKIDSSYIDSTVEENIKSMDSIIKEDVVWPYIKLTMD